jgi:hypothetical protein
MSKGRPPGVKNREGHNAGGKREHSGRLSAINKAANAPGQQKIADFFAKRNAYF